ncbi:hypothetical protein Cgig2_023138 [Carnegiea gigantea]|uniref:Uncharacterized protein n=1 Tax=Carnegiea gigantea TaxID=171969 RepID=A0A9Q1GKF9_9CARY|nr:hypothetical protein Cgig2_023138 [Carnegiea gigantea]
MTDKDQHRGDVQMMNKAQQGTLGLEMVSMRCRINQKLNRRRGFLHLQVDIIPEKMVWPERHNIPKCGELIDMIQGQVDGSQDFRRNFIIFVESVTGFERGYLENTLDKASMTDEEEQVNEKEHHTKGVEDEGKAEDQTGISKVKAAIDLIITKSQPLMEVITELEELIPKARSPLKRVRKVAGESVSNAIIRDTSKRSKTRTLINAIEKHFAGSRDKVHDFTLFAISNFSLGVSQEEKELLLEGVVVVDSQPDSLAGAVQVINYDLEDIVTRCVTTSPHSASAHHCCRVLLLIVL